MELRNKYKAILDKAGINTPFRLAHFFAQLEHESGLKPISENLNYSADGLLRTFPRYFTTAQAREYARKPEAIANRVYANRMGNRAETSGDGWKYRGRGFIQLTGKKNYKALTDYAKVDYVANPDLLLNEADAMISAIWFWSTNNLNRFADKDDATGLTKAINGGTNGLEHRRALTTKYKSIFNA